MAEIDTSTDRGSLLQRLRTGRRHRIERRMRRQKARRLARERRQGKVRVRTRRMGDLDAIEQLQTELPREVLRWSRDRAVRLDDLMVPAVTPHPGQTFRAPGRASDGRQVFVNCVIARRVPWRRATDTVKFRITEQLPEL